MATATPRTTTAKKSVTETKDVPHQITLTLSLEEAAVLKMLVGHVGSIGDTRELTNNIYYALEASGMKYSYGLYPLMQSIKFIPEALVIVTELATKMRGG